MVSVETNVQTVISRDLAGKDETYEQTPDDRKG
jgi:hypothetical protein